MKKCLKTLKYLRTQLTEKIGFIYEGWIIEDVLWGREKY